MTSGMLFSCGVGEVVEVGEVGEVVEFVEFVEVGIGRFMLLQFVLVLLELFWK